MRKTVCISLLAALSFASCIGLLLVLLSACFSLVWADEVEFACKIERDEKHVGLIAEEASPLLATEDRKGMSSMDVVAVLTKVVQEQQKTVQ